MRIMPRSGCTLLLESDVWPARLQHPLHPLARVMAGSMAPDDPSDRLVTLDAEDVFDSVTG